MEIITPYTDNKLVYDEELNRYELSKEWVLNNFNNPFQDDEILKQRIKRNTRKVYNYIFSVSYSANRKTINAIINHTEEYREWIKDCLEAQMEADLASAFNDNTLFPSKSREERQAKREDEICIDCEHIVDSSVGYGGINITCQCAFPTTVYLKFMGYAK